MTLRQKPPHEMNIIALPRINSTSTYLRESLPDAPAGTVVVTSCQSAGRGQRGNSWEAEPGKNLTFSVLLKPHGIDASSQYAISEAVAVAITDTLEPLVPDRDALTIKWPNDIYYNDRKLCGILIENTLSGMDIVRSIAGVGINVNQHEFRSDAPNPVSLWQIDGRERDLDTLLVQVATAIIDNVEAVSSPTGHEPIAHRYRKKLWRRSGLHPYSLPDGTTFMASIESVAPTGHITLRHADNTLTTHAFKEVSAIIKL